MKRYLYGLLPVCLFMLGVTGCKDDITTLHQGEAQNLVAEMSTLSAAIGDKVMFTVRVDDEQGKGLVLNEDIDVKLTFSGTDKDGNPVDVKDVFPDFTGHIPMKIGDKQGFTEFSVNPDLVNYPIDATITPFVRGYKINMPVNAITVSDRHYTMVALKNNNDNIVDEGGKAILMVTVGAVAKEDVVIKVTPKEEDKVRFEGLPESLVVRAGYHTTESQPFTIKGEELKNSFESVTLNFTTTSTLHPLHNSDKMVITVNDLDAGLDEAKKLTDEKWVYANPGVVFVSEENQKAVEKWNPLLTTLLIKEGDPHPTNRLAEQGWKFLNAMEFSAIDALTVGGKVNTYGNREPRFTAGQNVAGTQVYQAVRNDMYANMTDQGYLMMWSSYNKDLEATIWNGSIGKRNYGASAIYISKFNGSSNDARESSNVRILPGMRLEVRARIKGQTQSFNPAIWTQGNKDESEQWPIYGEVDILENPTKTAEGNNAYQTFHWNEKAGEGWKPTSHAPMVDVSEFNVYWMEWTNNDEIAMGINGEERVRITRDGGLSGEGANDQGAGRDWAGKNWPYSSDHNPEGMHLLLTFGCGSDWAVGKYQGNQPDAEWQKWMLETWIDPYLGKIAYKDSKTNPDTPRMEIDWICFYTKDNYKYGGKGQDHRNIPMY